MIPGYDFYAEEEDPSPYRWVVEFADGRVLQDAPAANFANDNEAAAELAKRRKTYRSYTVKLLKDGVEWEPGQ